MPHHATIFPDNRITDARAAFVELRTELRQRTRDDDLIALWGELSASEHRMLIASASLPRSTTLVAIEQQPHQVRDAIRAAIRRMSEYADRLGDRLDAEKTNVNVELARWARQSIELGDLNAAMHWVYMIEKGAA